MYIYNLKNKSLFPLNELSTIESKPVISYAVWSPTGHNLVKNMQKKILIHKYLINSLNRHLCLAMKYLLLI